MDSTGFDADNAAIIAIDKSTIASTPTIKTARPLGGLGNHGTSARCESRFLLNARRGPVTGDIVPNDEIGGNEQYVDLYT